MKQWLFATLRAMVAAFGVAVRREAIKVVWAFAQNTSASIERLQALENLLAQDQYGNPVLFQGQQVVACEYLPDEKYPQMPYVITCVNGTWRLGVKEAFEANLLTSHWVEAIQDEKLVHQPGLTGIKRLISDEELHELKLLQFAHARAEEGGVLQGMSSVTYRADGTLVRTRKARPHKRDDGTDSETVLFQDRVSNEEDETHEKWHYELASKLTKRRTPVTLLTTEVTRHANGRETWNDNVHGIVMREPARDEADVDREVEVRAFHDHAGYSGLKPIAAPTRIETALWSRDQYRIGWDMFMGGRKPDGGFGIWTYEGWRKLGLRMSFVPKGEKRSIRFWNKALVPVEFLRQCDEHGNVLVDGQREPERMRTLVEAKASGIRVERTFKAELEGMLRAVVEDRQIDAIEVVRRTEGRWTRIEGRPWPHGMLKMRCFTCQRKYGDSTEHTWRSDVHADYCPICGQEIWQAKLRLFARTEYLPFVDWNVMGQMPTHFTFEIYGNLVRQALSQEIKRGKPHWDKRLRRVDAEESIVHPRWVSELLPSASSENYWRLFRERLIKRYAPVPKRLKPRWNKRLQHSECFELKS